MPEGGAQQRRTHAAPVVVGGGDGGGQPRQHHRGLQVRTRGGRGPLEPSIQQLALPEDIVPVHCGNVIVTCQIDKMLLFKNIQLFNYLIGTN